MILCAATLVGIPVGIVINTRLSHDGFGLLLGIFAAAIGLLVCYRQRQRVDTQRPNVGVAVPELHDAATALVGICVGAASTLFGIGGPMLSVPLLVAAGVPILPALARSEESRVGNEWVSTCRELVSPSHYTKKYAHTKT